MFRITPSATLLGVLLAVTGLNATPIVSNGSFETPDASSSPYYKLFSAGQSFGGWTVDYTNVKTDVIHNSYIGGGVTWPDAVDGSQFLYLADSITNARIFQDLALIGGHSYLFSFYLSDFPSLNAGSGAWLSTDLVASPNGASLFGGAFVASHSRNPAWVKYSKAFNVTTTGSYRLSLTAQSGWAANVDAVSIDDTTPRHGVPDSASTSLLLASVGVVLLALRRRIA